MPHRSKIRIHLPPYIRRLKRGPQVILPKDAGIILTYSGVGKNSRVLEAGTGSGYLTRMLANFCKEVITYERDDRFYKLAKKNLSDVKNVKIKHQDIRDGIRERNLDLIVLDMPGSHEVIPLTYRALKPGGCLVGYNPNMEQVKQFVLKGRETGFVDDITVEVLTREILVREYGVRPASIGITHTAYLSFLWKPKDDSSRSKE